MQLSKTPDAVRVFAKNLDAGDAVQVDSTTARTVRQVNRLDLRGRPVPDALTKVRMVEIFWKESDAPVLAPPHQLLDVLVYDIAAASDE